MPKFPVDAPKQRVIKSLEILGFRMVREKEHILMESGGMAQGLEHYIAMRR